MVSSLTDVEQCIEVCCLSGRCQHSAYTTFKSGNFLSHCVIGGIGLLSLIAALLDLIINLKREKVIGAFLYASAGATVALVILGILAFNIPTVEKSSWDMLIVISGLALIVTGLLAMGATALEVIRYRANKFVEKNWNEFAEAADIKEEVTYEEMDPDNVIDVDAVDVEDKK